jgi:hypothetical protein
MTNFIRIYNKHREQVTRYFAAGGGSRINVTTMITTTKRTVSIFQM